MRGVGCRNRWCRLSFMSRLNYLHPIRRRPWLLLWMVPYLFLSAFGESLHQHPPNHAARGHQSTLMSSADAHSLQSPATAFTQPEQASSSSLSSECLICAWSSQNSGCFASREGQAPIGITATDSHLALSHHSSSFLFRFHTRGPPLSRIV